MTLRGTALYALEDMAPEVDPPPTMVSFDEKALQELLSQQESCGQELLESVKAGQHPVIKMADGSTLELADALEAFSVLQACRS